jgi:hypothetical protein
MFWIIHLTNRDDEDPKHNTRAQKTWIPGDDPGLKSLEKHLGFTADLSQSLEDRKQKMTSRWITHPN